MSRTSSSFLFPFPIVLCVSLASVFASAASACWRPPVLLGESVGALVRFSFHIVYTFTVRARRRSVVLLHAGHESGVALCCGSVGVLDGTRLLLFLIRRLVSLQRCLCLFIYGRASTEAAGRLCNAYPVTGAFNGKWCGWWLELFLPRLLSSFLFAIPRPPPFFTCTALRVRCLAHRIHKACTSEPRTRMRLGTIREQLRA